MSTLKIEEPGLDSLLSSFLANGGEPTPLSQVRLSRALPRERYSSRMKWESDRPGIDTCTGKFVRICPAAGLSYCGEQVM